MIVSKLIWANDALISCTGCTGGSIKLDVKHRDLIKPIYLCKIAAKRGYRNPALKEGNKFMLEEDEEMLRMVMTRHMIVARKGSNEPLMCGLH